MAKNNLLIIVIIVLIVGAFFYFQSPTENRTQIGDGELKREIPIELTSNTFKINYSTEKTGTWVVIIEDSVSGGCKFPNGKSEYKSVLIGQSLHIIEITAPNSGSCTFHGDYNFVVEKGIGPIKNFPDQTVILK